MLSLDKVKQLELVVKEINWWSKKALPETIEQDMKMFDSTKEILLYRAQ